MPQRFLLSSIFNIGAGVLLAFICAAPAAYAQPEHGAAADPAVVPAHDAGTAGKPQMTLQASASEDVKEDTVVITLAAQVSAQDQASAGRKLNALLDDLMKRAKTSRVVEPHTGYYRVWANNNDKGRVVDWRGEGAIVLESTDFDAASELAGKLGDKSAISNISFTLSRKAREAAERRLLNDAAQAFRDRALAAASAFGFSGYRLQKLDLGSAGIPPRPYMSLAKGAAAQARADVPLEANSVTVSVSVNGTIVLQ